MSQDAPVMTTVGVTTRYPRSRSSIPSGSSAASRLDGRSRCTCDGSPRAAYHSSTCSTEASIDDPESPSGRTELPRPVNPEDARSIQSPSHSSSTARQPSAMRRSRSRVETAVCGRPRRTGAGGTALTTTTSARRTCTGPAVASTVRPCSSTAVTTPMTSVRGGREPAGRRYRTTTRRPTCSGRSGTVIEGPHVAMRCAVGCGDEHGRARDPDTARRAATRHTRH